MIIHMPKPAEEGAPASGEVNTCPSTGLQAALKDTATGFDSDTPASSTCASLFETHDTFQQLQMP